MEKERDARRIGTILDAFELWSRGFMGYSAFVRTCDHNSYMALEVLQCIRLQ
jgi:hypothetical protein